MFTKRSLNRLDGMIRLFGPFTHTYTFKEPVMAGRVGKDVVKLSTFGRPICIDSMKSNDQLSFQ